ncbi:hypothetical protein BC835DRAFT_1423291 [Cytidiella melzeri]|nr:hypothetical protein BC835DRAFT_1423291 [Cytidiella melzeri]
MVRAHAKPPPEEKKETSQKKKPHSKTGLWACKINDCNKCFAREADLKRHQRTTKGHSQPGYACPQCDATFTRTDALRRHQKSRHNGVIIESSNSAKTSGEDTDDTDASMSATSRDGSLAGDIDDQEDPKTEANPPKLEASSSSSRASYYRSQAAHPSGHRLSFVIGPFSHDPRLLVDYVSPLPPPPAIFIEGGYPHAIAIPTSAARLQWPAAPPWSAEGSPIPPPPPQLYPVSSYYHSPPYNRQGPPMIPPGYPLRHPPDYLAQLMHPVSGPQPTPPPPGAYPTNTPLPVSVTRSTDSERSDTDGSEEEEDDVDYEDADSERDVEDDQKDENRPTEYDSQNEPHTGPYTKTDGHERQRRPGKTINGTSRDQTSAVHDHAWRDSTAALDTSPERPPPGVTGLSHHESFASLREHSDGGEEDTLSPRMREVALDTPLLLIAQESLASLRA